MTDLSLTDFQTEAAKSVLALLSKHGMQCNFETKGTNELFLYLCSPVQKLSVWVYDDEAEFRTGEVQRLYERPAYQTQAALLNEFMRDLADLLRSYTSGRDATQ
jgi:hypothetical protein